MRYLLLVLILALSGEVAAKSIDFATAMKKGQYYYNVNNFRAAIKYFKIAVSLEPDNPDPYYNAGAVAKTAGDCKNVLLFFPGYIYLVGGGTSKDVRLARSAIRQCARDAGKLVLNSNKPGLKVYVNGILVGETPISGLWLAPGRYTVEVIDENYYPFNQEVKIRRRETVQLDAVMKARTFYGYLNVKTEPVKSGVKVYVDGKYVGKTPLKRYRLVTGEHLVVLRARGYDEWQRYVEILKNREFTLEATLYRPISGQLHESKKKVSIPPQYEKVWKEFEDK